MVDNVVELDVVIKLDIPVERVIRWAGEAGLTEIVVLGFDADGEFYFASSKADSGDVLYPLEVAKLRLLNVCLGKEE